LAILGQDRQKSKPGATAPSPSFGRMPAMRLFVSAGEPSGDMHGANLIRALQQFHPGVEVLGFGGERMAESGCRLVFPLCDFAVVGLFRVLASLPHFARILALAEHTFKTERPDALVMIDYPGFHWWLARAARKHRIPVIYFVPPQIWAWGTWRHRKMRRLCDEVLCCLPFEESWLRERKINARYIGHPYFDELGGQRLDGPFLAQQRARPGTIIALLPGSRGQELHYNTGPLLRAAAAIHARRPDVRFLTACLKPHQRDQIEGHARATGLPIEVHAGRTPEIIQLAHSCLAVSGSVGLELLYRGKPSVVIYHYSRIMGIIGNLLKRSPYISLVNLLAGKMLYPEFHSWRCQSDRMAGQILHWLNDREAFEGVCGELKALRQRVAEPGACERAARRILEVVGGAEQKRRAA
jgi:lipid-A-disaccharide synthase